LLEEMFMGHIYISRPLTRIIHGDAGGILLSF